MIARHLIEDNMALKQQTPTPVRLPQELKDWIKSRAGANLRSVNAEITALLIKAREVERCQSA
ncbi:Arc family DNA-binding protein [Telluria sp. Tellsp99]